MNFKELINLNKNSVRGVIKKITNTQNEDLEQEVYIKVWKNLDKYEEKGKFANWINMIARNVSFDYLKRKKIECTDLENEEIENKKDEKPTPENIFIQRERQKRILKEIENLKPKLREVIILTEFYGMTYEACAKKINCPEGTVKSRIHTAKKELAEKLKDLL